MVRKKYPRVFLEYYSYPEKLINHLLNIDIMATLVKFLKESEGEITAFFPQLNYHRHNNLTKTCYAHVGQHSGCSVDYANECVLATKEEYKDLLIELISIGYDLKVLNKL